MGAPRKDKQIIDVSEIPGYASPEEALRNLPSTTGGSSQADDPQDDDYDDVTELNKVLDELGAVDGDTGFVTVYREVVSRIGGKREDEYIDRFNVGEFTLADLKERFGAGRYKVSVYRPGGKGLATRKVIVIAQTAQPIAAAPVSVGADIGELVKVMSAGFQQLGQLIIQARPAETSRTDMLRELAVLKELFATPATTAQPAGNPLEMFKLGLEMAQATAGGPDNNAWVGKALETFGPLLADAVLSPKQPVQAAPVQVALPAPAHAARPQAQSQPQQEDEPAMNMMLKAYLRMVLSAAQKNEPFEEYADNILNMLPSAQVPEIEAILRSDTWMHSVTNLVPQAAQYAEWFTGLRNTLLTYIDEDAAAAILGSPVGGLTQGGVSANVQPHENANTHIAGDNNLDPQSLT